MIAIKIKGVCLANLGTIIKRMKTLVDLRNEQNDDFYEKVENLFDKPLEVIRLGDQAIRACTGCWNCWLKTPGRCVFKDQMTEFYPKYVNSDAVILLMNTAQGFINHRAKAFFD